MHEPARASWTQNGLVQLLFALGLFIGLPIAISLFFKLVVD